MSRNTIKEAPNYTTPALVMGAVNLFWVLCVIWVLYGWLALLPAVYVLDRLIIWLGHRRA